MSGGSLFNSSADDDFDAEFDTQPESAETSPTSIDELVDEVDDSPEEEEELDDEMSEAERRISLAGYYKLLAKGGVFNDGSDEAKVVDKELKSFARDRVVVLLNLPSQKPKIELPFNEQQIEALLSMANRIIERQTLQPVNAVVPAVRPLAAPVAPVASRPTKPAGPQIKPLVAPLGAKKPAPAVVKKVVKVAPAPIAKVAAKKKDVVHTAENTALGEIFEENGKKYKFVPHPENGDILKINVSAARRQVAHPGAIPMPQLQQMEQLSEQIAHLNVNANPAMKNQQLVTAAAFSAANREE